jgi:nucleoside-diphosphate-sugar epimerase
MERTFCGPHSKTRRTVAMKKVLVTGATGFIGRYVVNELLSRGVQVVATSANSDKARTFDWYHQVTYVPFDLSAFDPSANYFDHFHRPDLMVHLAWEGLPNYKDAFHEEVNLPRHFTFLSNLIQHGLQDLTVTGTCFEYGMQEGELGEGMPVFPANPYARAKDTLRRQLDVLRQSHPYVLKWVRLFYMYGKGQSSKSLLSQLEAAIARGDRTFNMSGGEQVRDFLPVEKVSSYIAAVSLQTRVTGIINCCSGSPIKVKDFVSAHLQRLQGDLTLNLGYYPYPDYEPMSFWGNNRKLRSVIENGESHESGNTRPRPNR